MKTIQILGWMLLMPIFAVILLASVLLMWVGTLGYQLVDWYTETGDELR